MRVVVAFLTASSVTGAKEDHNVLLTMALDVDKGGTRAGRGLTEGEQMCPLGTENIDDRPRLVHSRSSRRRCNSAVIHYENTTGFENTAGLGEREVLTRQLALDSSSASNRCFLYKAQDPPMANLATNEWYGYPNRHFTPILNAET